MDCSSKEKLKVCWLVTGSEAYGRGAFICQIVPRLARRDGFVVYVIATDKVQYLGELADSGAIIHSLGFSPTLALKNLRGWRSIRRICTEFVRHLRIIFAVAKLVRKYRPDIIHTHVTHNHIVAAIIGYLTGIKVVWHWHGPYIFTGLPHFLMCLLRSKATASISISGFVQRTLPKYFQRTNQVVYNGIELSANQRRVGERFRKKYDIPQDKFLVGSFGAVLPRKGFRYFIEAIPKILEKQPNVCFVLVGGPTGESSNREWERLHALIEELGISGQIILTGLMPNAAKYMVDFDVIVVPTIPYENDPGEGFG
ncbi:MAG: glycosyltransferase, partial [Candidatus Cloacimonadota bacterium]